MAMRQLAQANRAVVEYLADHPELLHLFSAREERIIEARHQGRTEDCRTLKQLADELGISPERVRQIEGRVFRELRHMASEKLTKCPACGGKGWMRT